MQRKAVGKVHQWIAVVRLAAVATADARYGRTLHRCEALDGGYPAW